MGRIPELDALRGIAALVIVVFHMRFLEAAPVMGSAVDLFFVLSGYLITTIIFNHGRTSGFLTAFYARRALRIWPIYYIGLFLCVLLNPLLTTRQPLEGIWHYVAYVQYIPKYWGGDTPPFSRLFLHSWTLAMEEQFYLVWPVLAVLLGRKKLRYLSLLLVVLPICLRAHGLSCRLLLLSRSDSLALGTILADLFYDRESIGARKSFYHYFFISLGIFSVVARWWIGPMIARLDTAPGGEYSVWVAAFSIAEMAWFYFALVGLVLLHQGSSVLPFRILRHRALTHLGTISYGIYLYHPFLLALFPVVLKWLGIRNNPWFDPVKVGICIVFAQISWRLIERPLLSFKDRFPYRASRTRHLRGPHSSVRVEPHDRSENQAPAVLAGSRVTP
jgi:peptidoglycan/LPS O-acetylase OafA/YrhL